MNLRGPLLITASLSTVLALFAYHQRESRDEALRPTMIETVGGQQAACQSHGVDTLMGRLGCTNNANTRTNRRRAAGGAVFIRSGG